MNRLKKAVMLGFGLLASLGITAGATLEDPDTGYYEAYAAWDSFSYQYFCDTYAMRTAFESEQEQALYYEEEDDEDLGVYSYSTLNTCYPWDSMTNCMLTCKFWNGRILPAWSTTDFIGTMAREDGYEGMIDAMCIINVDEYGNSIKGYEIGGGICAGAVAAGNAADGTNIVASGTEHTERSIYIRPEDDDYTVSEGVVDLYLTNCTAYDYRVNMWVNPDWTVTCVFTPVFAEDEHAYTQEPEVTVEEESIPDIVNNYEEIEEEYPYLY